LKRLAREVCCRQSSKRQAQRLPWVGIDSRTFARFKPEVNWLVKDVLREGEPGVIGGAEKTLKTSQSVDLVVSVGSGTPFLGRFEVPRARRVWFFSGESGRHAIWDQAQRVCRGRGIDLADVRCTWSFALPPLNNLEELELTSCLLRDCQGGLVVIDPLYLCATQGGGEVNVSSMFDLGPLLSEVNNACREAGCTLVFNHHTVKDIEPGRPLNLRDLAYCAGAWARQWYLINRRRAYDFSGKHELVVALGGSAGHASLLNIDIDEGPPRPGDPARKWTVAVRDRAWATEGAGKAKGRAPADKQKQVEAVIAAFQRLAGPTGEASMRQVRDAAGLSGASLKALLPELAGRLEVVHGTIPRGNGYGVVKGKVFRAVNSTQACGTGPELSRVSRLSRPGWTRVNVGQGAPCL
jgi:hypothetical protein